MEKKQMRRTYLFLDTETTGLNPFENDIIEIGAALFLDKEDKPELVANFQASFSAHKDQVIDLEALQVNGRSVDSVFSEDPSMRDAMIRNFADWCSRYVDKDTLVIGHNISFDLAFLQEAGERLNLDFSRILSDRKAIDTKQLAMFLNDAYVIQTKNNRLVTLVNELFGEKNDENTHKAYADAMDDAAVYFKMRELV